MKTVIVETKAYANDLADLCREQGMKAYIIKLNDHAYEVRAW